MYMYVVRPAEISDADAVFVLARDMAMSFVPERSEFDNAFKDNLARDHVRVSVAEIGDEVVGYLLGVDHYTFYANGRVSWVEEVAVQPQLRRKGIGRALMEDFERWARGRGSKLVA